MRLPRYLLALCTTLLLVTPHARAELLEGIAAVVGEDVILRSELDAATLGAVQRIREQGGTISPEDLRMLRGEALKSLIDEKLVTQVAAQARLAASPEDIDAAIASMAAEEGVEVEQIYAAAEDHGLSRDRYREQLGQQITRMKVIQGSIQQRVAVSDAEVRELYEQRYESARPGNRIRVLHILIPMPPEATPEQKEDLARRVENLRNRALESGNFPGLARQFSAAPSAEQGGLTVMVESEAPRALRDALEGMSPGEITPVVSNRFGFNLFQFLDRFDPSQIPYEQVEAQLRAELVERRTMPEFRKWLDEVRETRYIEVVHPDLK